MPVTSTTTYIPQMLFFQNSAFNSTKVEVLFFSVGIKQPQNCFVALSLSFVCTLNVTFLPRQICPWACAVLLITPGSHRTLKRRAAPRLPNAVKRSFRRRVYFLRSPRAYRARKHTEKWFKWYWWHFTWYKLSNMYPIVCIPLLLSWSFNFTNFTNHIIKCPPLPIHYSHTFHIGKKRERGGGGGATYSPHRWRIRHLPSTPDIERTKHPWQISAVCVITERNRRMTGVGKCASGVNPALRSSPAFQNPLVRSSTLN